MKQPESITGPLGFIDLFAAWACARQGSTVWAYVLAACALVCFVDQLLINRAWKRFEDMQRRIEDEKPED